MFQLDFPRIARVEGPAAARWLWILTRLIVVLIGVGTLLGLAAAVRGIAASGQAFHHEGWMVFSILQVRDGAPLYPDYHAYPFNLALYTPLYYEVVGTLARILSSDANATVMLARATSAVATLGSVGLLFAIARQCGVSRYGATVATGLFISAYIVHPWLYVARPDALALVCCLGGLWAGLRWPGLRGAVLAALLLTLAFHTKQSYVAAAGAFILGTMHLRQWRRAIVFATVWSASVGAGLMLEHVLTAGLFAASTITPNVLPMRLDLVLQQVRLFLILGGPLLLLGLIGWCGEKTSTGSLTVLRWYTLLAAGAGLFATAKIGASYNQFLELAVMLAVFGGRGVEHLWRLSRHDLSPVAATSSSRARLLAIPLAAWIVASACLPGAALLDHVLYAPDETALVRAIAEAPGEVLTERDSLAVVRAGKTAVFADPFGVALLSQGGHWNPMALNTMIERQEFSLIVLATPLERTATFDGFPWWPAGTEARIREHYVLADQSPTRLFYVPKDAHPTAGLGAGALD
ncbi:MAG: hypothetical protein IT306_00485 [Chloroflexi bacterium]|nr:hypothetical protein [Chloroflexota bacterium]